MNYIFKLIFDEKRSHKDKIKEHFQKLEPNTEILFKGCIYHENNYSYDNGRLNIKVLSELCNNDLSKIKPINKEVATSLKFLNISRIGKDPIFSLDIDDPLKLYEDLNEYDIYWYIKKTIDDAFSPIQDKFDFSIELIPKLDDVINDKQSCNFKFSTEIYQDLKELSEKNNLNMTDYLSKLIKKEKKLKYIDKSYFEKRKILRKFSIHPDISYYLSIMTEILHQKLLEKRNTWKETLTENNINLDSKTLREYIKTLLIDGYLSFEIIFDDKQEKIIELRALDPDSLKPVLVASKKIAWSQTIGNTKRILTDDQIIHISYSNDETSYVESLLSPYKYFYLDEEMPNIDEYVLKKNSKIPESILLDMPYDENSIILNSFVNSFVERFSEIFNKINKLKLP